MKPGTWPRQRPGVLCLLFLGAALGACAPSGAGSGTGAPREMYTVVFDKNGGDTEAAPNRIALVSPASTVGHLPTPPTRAGYTFGGWNTERDGSGSPFTVDTVVTSNILTIVYAQWRPPLGFELSRDSLTFSPVENGAYNERFPALAVTVGGLKNEADADNVQLDIRTENERLWFSWQVADSGFSKGGKTFVIHFSYHGAAFTEAPVTLRLQLKNIPPDYGDAGEPRTLHLAAANGEKGGRPIPVRQDNLLHFNRYATTTPGLRLYYQLVEDVKLPAEQPNNWTAIGTEAAPFTGSFDGGGHSIVGLHIHLPSASNQGLFGYISGEGALIENLGLEGSTVTGQHRVGSLVGRNESGTVRNSHATGNVSGRNDLGGVVGANGDGGRVENSHATGSVSGDAYVGGVVGRNSGTVHNGYATGNVSGNAYVGGVVGWNVGPNAGVEACHAQGNVTGTGTNIGGVVGENDRGRVDNSYATGNVSGDTYVGGVVGRSSGTVHNCYATGKARGNAHVGGVAGFNNTTLQNCVALNPRVTVTGDNFLGRLMGSDAAYLNNSYAREDMLVLYNTNPDGSGGSSKPALGPEDGMGVSAETYNLEVFWRETLQFPETVWELGANKLPILMDLGGHQNPVVPPIE